MNMQGIMAQARKMQKDIEKVTKELESKVYSEKVGFVTIEMNGKRENTSVKIDVENVDDIEMLEDMIITAINKVNADITKDKEAKLGKYTAGLGDIF